MKLKIEGLRVVLQKQTILNDLSLTVEEGEFLSLLGPSGCGKSTLLKTVAGILPMAAGRLRLGGEDISRMPAHRRGAVIVFQDMRLFPHMSAAENVAFPLKMQGTAKKERQRAADELLERVQLRDYGSRRVSQLSGGQQQRVALARALAARPRLLLLDEPFSALDENLREEMRALVLSLHRDFRMTTVLVTHDRAEALSMSHRVAVMFDGAIVQCGTPEEVYARPASRRTADYFGGCAYLLGEVRAGVFTAPELSCPVEAPDGRYELMLRPSALRTDCPGPLALTVTGIQFQGAELLVTLESVGGAVWKKPFGQPPPWQVGDTLSCAVDGAHGVLFPA